ncbi:acetyl-CoA carboxylase [Loktanella salsilacus]|jgi:acetyl-CoA carboxylase biotin carboxyl carrier protein|uniref:acetyl-CoA carboxylase n=1 Tax=Loktanella salsilacus TaxID=195913 RepID=UPI0020B7C2A7|nr:acetyl-CoA carboxylase [Loktanella salsilacus]UTH45271.1 biotin carboxyl carrier domain-containing protein [Loktanella salsilacus]
MLDIQSPLPGTFYQKAAPDEADYKTTGDAVAVGDTIGLIEVMKTFIEIKAETAGTFDGYVAENEAPVTAGAVLARLQG